MELRIFVENVVKKYLNESMGRFSIDDVFDAIITNGSFEWYDLYPKYKEPLNNQEETMFQTKEKAEQYANYVIDTFNDLPNNIPIYRAIHAKSENDIDFEYLGESWSLYKDSAIQFGSHNGSNYLISATIDKKHVNWEETLKRFTLFSFGDDADDENEIVIRDESEIKNVMVDKLKWKQ